MIIVFIILLFLNSSEIKVELGPGLIFSQSIYKSKRDNFIPIPFLKFNYSKISFYATELSYELYESTIKVTENMGSFTMKQINKGKSTIQGVLTYFH